MIRGRIFGTEILEPGDYGLPAPRSVTALRNPVDTTSHYAGPTDWRHAGIDRSSAERFRLTTDHGRCAPIVLAHADFHMRTSGGGRGWVHYAYSGSSCPHGVSYIGRGRGVRTAANGTSAGNDSSYAIQYTGGGPDDPITDAAKRAFIDLADYLGAPLRREHADHKATACSGPQIRPWRRAGFPRPSGATPTPAPKPPPAPPIEEEDDDMLIIVKGDKSPEWWLSTNLVTKRHARTAQQVAEAVWLTVAAGGKVSTRPGNAPHVLPQSSVDSIPTVGAEGPRDHAIELRVIDVRNELDRITEEVRRFAGEPR